MAVTTIDIEHRVSYGETDMMQVVYYGEYFHYFERVRNELFRSSGRTYKEFEELGYFLPVRHADCRYRSPALYDDLLTITCTVGTWKKASISFDYTIYCKERDCLIATGTTELVCVNKDGRPIAFPTFFTDALTS